MERMTRRPYMRIACWCWIVVACTACGSGDDPRIEGDTPPDGAVASTYNVGDGTTCAPSTTGCFACFLGGSIRACPVDWQYRNSFAFVATDGLAPYFWSAASLPPGITVSRSGSIGGTPTEAGTYTTSVTVTDSSFPARRETQTVTIVIDPSLPPTITVSPAPAKGAINRPYTNVFDAAGGALPLTWSETGTLPPGLDFADDGTLSGTPTAVGAFPITVTVEDASGQSATAFDTTIDVLAHGFRTTSAMTAPRTLQTATLLDDGRVLVAGGFDGTNALRDAELYDPGSATFVPTGSLTDARYLHTSTLLDNDTVLLVGGLSAPDGAAVATAQLFAPSSGRFSTTDAPIVARYAHTATRLDDGTVLITGGTGGGADAPLASAEIYDPGAARFIAVGTMTAARSGHTATLLSNGDVLVVGGIDSQRTALQTAEIFDTRTRRFTATGSMREARAHQAAVLLPNGRVLIAGGIANEAIATAEIYDPATGAFSPTGDMRTAHSAPTATLLTDDTVLVAGAGDAHTHLIADAELYDASAGTFTPTGSMTTARDGHTATLLPNGQVLVTGGSNGPVFSSADLYQ
jgi:hypothetical protein